MVSELIKKLLTDEEVRHIERSLNYVNDINVSFLSHTKESDAPNAREVAMKQIELTQSILSKLRS